VTVGVLALASLLLCGLSGLRVGRRSGACLGGSADMQQEMSGLSELRLERESPLHSCGAGAEPLPMESLKGELTCDFAHHIFQLEGPRGEALRIVKIRCPGVERNDVEVRLVFNGCDINIRRRSSSGVPAATWNKRFQFHQSEGLFEFKEDQMQLDHGFLQLTFSSRVSQQGRVVRFPAPHFSLAATDTDPHWDYLGEEAEPEGEEEDEDEAEAAAIADLCGDGAFGGASAACAESSMLPAVVSPHQRGGG